MPTGTPGSYGEGAAPDRSDDEADLVALAAGDVGAYEALFTRHVDYVYNVAFRRTASWSTAEDIAEVAFLELWRQRTRVMTSRGSLRPWLAGVVANQSRRRWRQLERQARAHGRVARTDGQDDPADIAAARIDDERKMAEVRVEMDRLPRQQREVLQLWAWEELSYEEIAAALNLAVGTVRSRLSRARARLAPARGNAATPKNEVGTEGERA